jgi:hypothetical protein
MLPRGNQGFYGNSTKVEVWLLDGAFHQATHPYFYVLCLINTYHETPAPFPFADMLRLV